MKRLQVPQEVLQEVKGRLSDGSLSYPKALEELRGRGYTVSMGWLHAQVKGRKTDTAMLPVETLRELYARVEVLARERGEAVAEADRWRSEADRWRAEAQGRDQALQERDAELARLKAQVEARNGVGVWSALRQVLTARVF